MLTYKDAGVDISAAASVKKKIARMVRATYSPSVLSEIGQFGSLYELKSMRRPVLVASCDGVGTKLKVAALMNRHDTIGEDIVNHSVNDILTLGARPLFFLDYIAYASLPRHVLPEIIRGLVRGCRRNGCALIGGETAMMPGLYPEGEYDLAGTIVGAVEKQRIIRPERIRKGDIVLGLPSNGLHTNGYALARKVLFDKMRLSAQSRLPIGCGSLTVGQALLKVHRSYLKPLRPFLNRIHALAHITGGGFSENIERLLPQRVDCLLYRRGWQVPGIFRIIQQGGNISDEEMYRVFNMGIGMVAITDADSAETMLDRIRGVRVIGEIVRGTGKVEIL